MTHFGVINGCLFCDQKVKQQRTLGVITASAASKSQITASSQVRAAIAIQRVGITAGGNSWKSDPYHLCRMGAQTSHALPTGVMSNQVAPVRERRPIAAKDVHCLGGRDFGWTAPSQVCLVFTRAVQMHDR